MAGLVAKGYDFKVVYKWGRRAREIRLASQYLRDVQPGGLIHEAEQKDWRVGEQGADYLREVFIANPPGLVRYAKGVAADVGLSVAPGDVIEAVAGIKVVGAGVKVSP